MKRSRAMSWLGLALLGTVFAPSAVAQDTSWSLRLWERCVEEQVARLDDGRRSVASLAREVTVNCRHVVELADIRGDLPNEMRDGSAIVQRWRARRR